MPAIMIIGCGYSGERIARAHASRGDRVFGTTRDAARAASLAAAGVETCSGPADADFPAEARMQRIYYTVPPPAQGLSDTRLAATLARLQPPEIFIYFSTTGVYGDCGGATVNENSTPSPVTPRAHRRLHEETQVRQWCANHGTRAVILRIAGIYGPGRLPLDALARGEPVPDPAATGPGNRIHVDDLAQAAIAIADSGESGTWNISDGNPLSNADFTALVAKAAGLPLPRRVPLDSAEISPGKRSFLREQRRIDNARLLRTPGIALAYPDPADGIRASLLESLAKNLAESRV